jgi:hypothetical protein
MGDGQDGRVNDGWCFAVGTGMGALPEWVQEAVGYMEEHGNTDSGGAVASRRIAAGIDQCDWVLSAGSWCPKAATFECVHFEPPNRRLVDVMKVCNFHMPDAIRGLFDLDPYTDQMIS